MSEINIKDYIFNCYATAKSKGFYTCPGCKDQPRPGWIYDYAPDNARDEHCDTCNGAVNYTNVPDLLMHVCGELSEVREAYRGTKRASLALYRAIGPEYFGRYIKGTPEEELADCFIILFSLAGYLKLEDCYISSLNDFFNNKNSREMDCFKSSNIGEVLFRVVSALIQNSYGSQLHVGITNAMEILVMLCRQLKVDIFPFIDAKMLYNISREEYNGKNF